MSRVERLDHHIADAGLDAAGVDEGLGLAQDQIGGDHAAGGHAAAAGGGG